MHHSTGWSGQIKRFICDLGTQHIHHSRLYLMHDSASHLEMTDLDWRLEISDLRLDLRIFESRDLRLDWIQGQGFGLDLVYFRLGDLRLDLRFEIL